MSKLFFLKNLLPYFLSCSFIFILLINAYSQEEEGIWRDSTFYKSMPLPISNGKKIPFTEPLEIVEYDVKTGITFSKPVPSSFTDFSNRQTFGSKGVDFDTTATHSAERVFTELGLINDPSVYPWRVNVRLVITPKIGDAYVCSGVFIDASFVLTAAHCIYEEEVGGWPISVEVVPGYSNGNQPYGSANATHVYAWNAWTMSDPPGKNWEWDMAYLKLDRPLGNTVGWHGYGYNNANTFFTQNIFNNPGYPSELQYNGQNLYHRTGEFESVETNLLYHQQVSYGGQSGSGSYYKHSSSDRRVYAVLSHTIGDRELSDTPTGHTRMTAVRFNTIKATINESKNCNTNWTLNATSINSSTYYAERLIRSAGQIERFSTVHFRAGNSITLAPNFHAKAGSSFSANIERINCTNFSPTSEELIAQNREKEGLTINTLDKKKQPFLKCFPNPASHSLMVTYSLVKDEQATLFLYNLEGQTILKRSLSPTRTSNEQQISIDISKYESGFYHLALMGDQTQLNEKVIIME